MLRMLIGCLILAGCQQTPQAPVATSAAPVMAKSLLSLSEVKSFVAKIEERSGASPDFLEFTVTEQTMEMRVLDPKKPGQADAYLLRAGEFKVEPLRTNGAKPEDLKRASIAWKQVKIEKLDSLVEQATKKSKSAQQEGARSPHMFIHRTPSGEPEWCIFVNGSRQTVYLDAKLDGSLKKLELR